MNAFTPVALFALFVTIANSVAAQNAQDVKSIKSMCGCYEVSFEFGETFAYQPNYKFYDNYKSAGLEWVQLVEDSKDKIVLQHLLIGKDSTGAPFITKHWRQDWIYQNRFFYQYQQDQTWTYHQLSPKQVKGQWTQKVFQVDDSPRYEATATWVHIDGRHYWEATADSPLPRREFTKRSDYDLLKRRNRQEITDYGWIHEQDNDKIVRRSNQPDTLIAREKGLDIYRRVDDSRCQAAQDWWAKNQLFWKAVRAEWAQIYNRQQTLQLHKTVDNQPLFMYLFRLNPEQTNEIAAIIAKFIKKQP